MDAYLEAGAFGEENDEVPEIDPVLVYEILMHHIKIMVNSN